MLARTLSLVALVAGCTADLPEGERPRFEDAEDTGDAAAEGPDDVEVHVYADDSAEVEISWTAPEGAASYIEFGYDESYGNIAPAGSETSANAVLLGLKADTLVHARVLTVVDGEVFPGQDFTLQTAPLPDGLPTVDVEVAAAEGLYERFALLTLFDTAHGEGTVMVVDHDGDPVWWDQLSGPMVPAAHRTADGLGIVYRNDDPLDGGHVFSVRFDQTRRTDFSDPHGHHDLVELPGVGIATIEADVREWNGEMVAGDRIVEIDERGERRIVWSTWDDFVPDQDWIANAPSTPLGKDWTHANGIDYDARTDSYLLSILQFHQVLSISRGTGELDWQLGGDDSDFTFPADSGFAPQHAPVAHPDGLWLFDNHTGFSGEPMQSRVVRYVLEQDMEARVSWEWTPDETLSTPVLGDVRPLTGGNVLAAFGAAGRAAVVSSDGIVLWQLQVDRGMVMGRGDVFRSFYGQTDIVVE